MPLRRRTAAGADPGLSRHPRLASRASFNLALSSRGLPSAGTLQNRIKNDPGVSPRRKATRQSEVSVNPSSKMPPGNTGAPSNCAGSTASSRPDALSQIFTTQLSPPEARNRPSRDKAR